MLFVIDKNFISNKHNFLLFYSVFIEATENFNLIKKEERETYLDQLLSSKTYESKQIKQDERKKEALVRAKYEKAIEKKHQEIE